MDNLRVCHCMDNEPAHEYRLHPFARWTLLGLISSTIGAVTCFMANCGQCRLDIYTNPLATHPVILLPLFAVSFALFILAWLISRLISCKVRKILPRFFLTLIIYCLPGLLLTFIGSVSSKDECDSPESERVQSYERMRADNPGLSYIADSLFFLAMAGVPVLFGTIAAQKRTKSTSANP